MATPPTLSVLAPWRAALRGLRVRPVVADGEGTAAMARTRAMGVWLQWGLPANAPRAATTHFLEAVELLVLLSWGDQSAWIETAETFQSQNYYSIARQWKELVVEAYPFPRVLGHELVGTDAQLVCAVLGSWDTDDNGVSSQYKVARAVLEAAIINGGGGDRSIPFRVRLMPRRPWTATTTTLGALPALAALAEIQQRWAMTHQAPSGPEARRFIFQSRLCEVRSNSRVTNHVLQVMMAIWARGVAVVDFPVMDHSLEPRDRRFYVRTLRSLFGVDGCGCVRRVSIGHPLEPDLTPTLLSALAVGSSVREATYEFPEIELDGVATTRRAVQWMTYAVFSGHATNTITKVSLACQYLSAIHIDAIRELLEADDPLAVLYPDRATDILAYRRLRISASSMMLDQPTLPDSRGEVVDVEATDRRVIGRSHGWWCVLLPGWGEAYVDENRAVVTQVGSSTTRANRFVPVMDLSGFSDDNNSAIRSLLLLIGRDLQRLHFDQPIQPFDQLCEDSFSACPLLEELVLPDAQPDGLARLPAFFATGRCKHLQRLAINMELVTNSTLHAIGEMFEALADFSHPMGQQLATLDIDGFAMDSGAYALDSDVLTKALHMLRNNSRLERLRLHLPLTTQDTSSVERLKQGFDEQHGTQLPIALEPWGSSKKSAFLSVVWGTERGRSSVMHQFDRHIVAQIFAFTPERRCRRVDVAMPR